MWHARVVARETTLEEARGKLAKLVVIMGWPFILKLAVLLASDIRSA